MYQALYRKYRPSEFDEVAGQKVVVKTLKNAIKNNRINHAYLFCGPRGTGKTSIAKIFAKIVNCKNLKDYVSCNKCDSCIQINNKQNIDIIEIDAASNNGVDEIRELKNNVNLVPSNGKYKVYIIDEVHMLTQQAFNALLKTLEEPPSHVIFILATTEEYKIPATILSRCQKFNFDKISVNNIVEKMRYICEQEKIEIEENALNEIAIVSNGGMRDALSLLDQLRSYCDDKININDVNELDGNISNEQMFVLFEKIRKKDIKEIMNIIEKYDDEGKNFVVIVNSILRYLKNYIIYLNDSDFFKKEEQEVYSKLVSLFDEDKIYIIIELLLDAVKNIKIENDKKMYLEIVFLKIINKISEIKLEKSEVDVNIINSVESIKSDTDKAIENIIQEDKQKKIVTFNKINALKKIRINNALSKFNRKDMIDFSSDMNKFNEYLMNPNYSNNISLILDGNLKAKGDNYIIIMFENDSLEKYYNSNLIEIDKLFQLVFNKKYNTIAVNENEWNKIKVEFNNALKNKENKYKYIEETLSLEEYFNSNEDEENETIDNNVIDNMFSEIVEYQ